MRIINTILNQFTVHADSFLESNGLNVLIGWVVGISTGIAIVSIAVCIIRIMISDDVNAIAQAKSDIKTVIIAWIVLNSLGAVFASLVNLIDMENY